jgi:hypothetical protein
VQAVHLSLVRQGSSSANEAPEKTPAGALAERLLKDGPQALNAQEKTRLLWDGDTVFWLHQELWSRPSSEIHPMWQKLQAGCSTSPLLENYLTSK